MNFFRRRAYLKEAKHALHEIRHARRMREDIASDVALNRLKQVEAELRNALSNKDIDSCQAIVSTTGALIGDVMPPHRAPWIREHVEILVVAITIAMAIRSYFVQPFKIPTGSMQPTLYGITVENLGVDEEPGLWDRFPFKMLPFLLTGSYYTEVRARAAGMVRITERDDTYDYATVGGARHRIRRGMRLHFEDGSMVRRGQLLANGRFRYGDHLFVDKMSYNFRRPQRGDIFVFRTGGINHPRIRDNTYYIKRLVGLPNEEIGITPPFIRVNGELWQSPHVDDFPDRIWPKDDQEYYLGYHFVPSNDARLKSEFDVIRLGSGQYFPVGDNTRSSLDGRYFGGVDQEDIVGPAFVVYWPFTKRWGRIP